MRDRSRRGDSHWALVPACASFISSRKHSTKNEPRNLGETKIPEIFSDNANAKSRIIARVKIQLWYFDVAPPSTDTLINQWRAIEAVSRKAIPIIIDND
jgi:hypothetical protein